jgi:uncharacterized membrane protein YdjX (TVP38/TMEM64 family)
LVLAVVIGLIVTLMILWREPLMSVFTDRERLSQTIKETGAFGPLIFVAVQILQTVIAPIPGQVTGIVGGALFGWMGVVWSLLGSIIGAYLVFKLVRRFGRSFAEKILSPKILQKFDFAISQRGAMPLFLMFLLPIFPDSVLCYIAGLTTISIRTLMVIWIAGRAPSTLVNNLIGEGMSRSAIRPTILVVAILIIVSTLAYLNRRWLQGLVSADQHWTYIKENWPYRLASTIVWTALLLVALAGITYLVLTV